MILSAQAKYNGIRNDNSVILSINKALTPNEVYLMSRSLLKFPRHQCRIERRTTIGQGNVIITANSGTASGYAPNYEACVSGSNNGMRGYATGATRTDSYCFSTTAEIDWPLVGPLSGMVSAHLGEMWDNPSKMLCAGTGVRIASAFGTFHIEYTLDARKNGKFQFRSV